MHKQKIAHRDLKPENILVKGGKFLIADLGCAKHLDSLSKKLKTAKGTTRFMSPQVLKGCRNFN